MDLRTGLDAALLQRSAERAERVEEARVERRREAARRPAVEFGGALAHLNETEETESVDAAATADKARDEIRRQLDILA